MDTNLVANSAAVIIGLASIASSSVLAWRALRITQTANYMPIILDFLKVQRTPDFSRKEKRVWDDLKKHDSSLGLFGLPDEIRDDAIEVALYYQALSYLALYGFADPDFLAVQTHYRYLKTWETIKDHVLGERERRADANGFLNSYEEFTVHMYGLDVAEAHRRLVERGSQRLL